MPLFLGFLGVLAFSFMLPATRIAVEELEPTFVIAVLASVVATQRTRVDRNSRRPLVTSGR